MNFKSRTSILLSAFLFFFFCQTTGKLLAANLRIYVAVSGNDSNSGAKEQPLASLHGAVDKLREIRKNHGINDTIEVIIGDGEYFMTEKLMLYSHDSGKEGAPVIFEAEKGARPIFYGGKEISGFEEINENLWRAKVPETETYGCIFEQLYVNGKRAIRAKSPNNGFYHLKKVTENILYKTSGKTPGIAFQKYTVYPDGALQLSRLLKEDYQNAVITFYHKWDNTRTRIHSFDRDSATFFTVGSAFSSHNKINQESRYRLENYKAALDTCGEWYLDREEGLFYIPRKGESIANLKVIAPFVDRFIVIQGNEETGESVKNIRFEGLSFQVTGYRLPLAGDQPSQAAASTDAVIVANYAENIVVKNCEVSHTGTNAVWFRKACKNCRIEQCYLHDLGAGGIKIGDYRQSENMEDLTRNIVADNNIIRSGGYVFPCAVGVTLFHASDNQVTHNEIADFRYSGISVGWVWGYSFSPSKRNKIEYNHIHHLGWGELSDMGGIYCLGESEGTTVSNNVIHHVYSYDYGGWGLYTDEGSTGILMENNLVYNCKSSGFNQHYGKENVIRNNIFASNIIAQIQAIKIEEHLSYTFENNIVWFGTGDLLSGQWLKPGTWDKFNIKMDRNCYWDTRTKDVRFREHSFEQWKKTGRDVHSVIADPGFVNPSEYDFRFKDKKILRKIGFIPFDYTKAGVYGSNEWRQLATFDSGMANQFDLLVARSSVINK